MGREVMCRLTYAKLQKKAQSIKQNTPKTNAHHYSSAVSARVKQNETATFSFC